ncbi:hypothetical protein C5167_037305 [Papaver somniferum]|uniref:Cullin N-terminal domain-containing protein n=1 Tax=Papaver somniferum TaxID=3469 RepID=A0A4Y7I8H7_PAPSO|nr:hypothetical protein C5167_037305 [Papaver somniferum]
MDQRVLELEEGWAIVQKGITKLIDTIEGKPESPIDMKFVSILHETIYTMCTQKSPGADYSKQLYQRYGGVYGNYLQSIVLPAIQEKDQRVLELEEGWAIVQKGITKLIDTIEGKPESPIDMKFVSILHETIYTMCTQKSPGADYSKQLYQRYGGVYVLVSKLWRIFHYLDRHYTPRRRIPTVKDVGFGCFRKIVGELMKVRVKDVVISLIGQEREGREIDQTLIILGFYENGVARNRALDPAIRSRLKQFSAMIGVGTISVLIKQGDDIKCVISTKFYLVHINMY